MIKVVAREDESVDDLLKRFKKQVSESEIMLESRLHECYHNHAEKKVIKRQWRQRYDR